MSYVSAGILVLVACSTEPSEVNWAHWGASMFNFWMILLAYLTTC